MLVKSDIWREIAAIDLVVPSLDAVTPELFHQINRPNIGCDIAEIITALRNFSWQFTGDLQLEVLFLPGINDTDQEAQAIANACRTIRHSVVQIHTLDRPGTCCDLEPISNERLQELAKHFDKVTLPGRQYQSRPAEELAFDEIKQRIVGLIRLRPSTIPDMLSAIACEKTLLEQAINDLSKSGIIKTKGEFWVYAITAILTD